MADMPQGPGGLWEVASVAGGMRRRSGMARGERGWYAPADRRGGPGERFGRLAGISLAGLVIVLLFLAAGCLNIQLRIGNRPDTDMLERSLHLGESTAADVLAALGEPYGKGRTMLPIDTKPRTVWSYYYEEGTMEDARRIFLFVYFEQDRYDGYMWFSSLPK